MANRRYHDFAKLMLENLAKKKNSTPAQISLAWMLCKKSYIILILGSRKLSRLKENFSSGEIAELDAKLDTMNFEIFGGCRPDEIKTLIKQIKCFQAVVRCQSFTKAANDYFISQSAISQQIQALEKELGVKLLRRECMKISLTPAGEFFYKKSPVIISDFDRLCVEIIKFSNGVEQDLSIGYLRDYNGQELQRALQKFQSGRLEISINLLSGTHEEFYENLRAGKADVVISDLRREPSSQYVNFFSDAGNLCAELHENNLLPGWNF